MLLAFFAAGSASTAPPAPWSGVRTFGYQLQGLEASRVATFPADLIVMDYSADGSSERAFSAADVRRMQGAGARTRRLVAYMSIGEAEPYRFYWKRAWKPGNPAWLDTPNPDWPDNFRVQYWNPDWQRLIFGSETSYLDRILAAGFDGVYLDIVDGFERYAAKRPQARAEMIAFVKTIAAHARGRRPDFGVFPQNALELVTDPGYLAVITGVGKESTYWPSDEKPNAVDSTAYEESLLDRVTAAGKLVLEVDYCQEPAHIRQAKRRCSEKGYASYCTVVKLDRLIEQTGAAPGR